LIDRLDLLIRSRPQIEFDGKMTSSSSSSSTTPMNPSSPSPPLLSNPRTSPIHGNTNTSSLALKRGIRPCVLTPTPYSTESTASNENPKRTRRQHELGSLQSLLASIDQSIFTTNNHESPQHSTSPLSATLFASLSPSSTTPPSTTNFGEPNIGPHGIHPAQVQGLMSQSQPSLLYPMVNKTILTETDTSLVHYANKTTHAFHLPSSSSSPPVLTSSISMTTDPHHHSPLMFHQPHSKSGEEIEMSRAIPGLKALATLETMIQRVDFNDDSTYIA